MRFKRKQIEDKMGLDQYAYVAAKAKQRDEFYDSAEFNEESREFESKTVEPVREIAYWRKHPNLQGWMERLYQSKGGNGGFNGDEVELTWEDLDLLEKDINNGVMAGLHTTGFFFGDPSDDYYREQDLEFIKKARAELFLGLKVFYNSSW